MPHPAGRQLGKVSLVLDDAVAMSGPEDRGSSVLAEGRPRWVESIDGCVWGYRTRVAEGGWLLLWPTGMALLTRDSAQGSHSHSPQYPRESVVTTFC